MYGMDEATLFKFGKCVDYGKSRNREKIPPSKRVWSRSRDPFKDFKPSSIFLEWMKLHSLNLASGMTTASPTTRVKNSPERGVVWIT